MYPYQDDRIYEQINNQVEYDLVDKIMNLSKDELVSITGDHNTRCKLDATYHNSREYTLMHKSLIFRANELSKIDDSSGADFLIGVLGGWVLADAFFDSDG